MDSRLETFEKFIDKPMNLHSKFRFNCTMCGQCCIHREDILLNAKDVFDLASILGISCKMVAVFFGETYVGFASRMPIIRLLPVGDDHRCPFLMPDKRCAVHEKKPTVCALYPLGRFIKPDAQEKGTIGYYAFSILFQSLHGIAMGVWYQIAKWFYPGVSMAYSAEDSALECYLKWDPTGLFYRERYVLDGYIPMKPHGAMYIEGEDKIWTGDMEEVLHWLDEKLPFAYEHSGSVCAVENSIREKLEELEDGCDEDDEEKEDQYFFTFAEFVSFAPEEFEFEGE